MEASLDIGLKTNSKAESIHLYHRRDIKEPYMGVSNISHIFDLANETETPKRANVKWEPSCALKEDCIETKNNSWPWMLESEPFVLLPEVNNRCDSDSTSTSCVIEDAHAYYAKLGEIVQACVPFIASKRNQASQLLTKKEFQGTLAQECDFNNILSPTAVAAGVQPIFMGECPCMCALENKLRIQAFTSVAGPAMEITKARQLSGKTPARILDKKGAPAVLTYSIEPKDDTELKVVVSNKSDKCICTPQKSSRTELILSSVEWDWQKQYIVKGNEKKNSYAYSERCYISKKVLRLLTEEYLSWKQLAEINEECKNRPIIVRKRSWKNLPKRIYINHPVYFCEEIVIEAEGLTQCEVANGDNEAYAFMIDRPLTIDEGEITYA